MAVAVNQHYRKSTEEKELDDEAITSGRRFTTLGVGEILLVLWTYTFLLPPWALDLFMSLSRGKKCFKNLLLGNRSGHWQLAFTEANWEDKDQELLNSLLL